MGFVDILRRSLEGDEHCCLKFVTCRFDCVELFPCFRVSARRKETVPP